MRQVQPILGKAAGKVRAELKRREEAIKEREDRIRKLEEQDAVHWKTRRALIKERDAALARYADAARMGNAWKDERDNARAEAEALRERGLKLRRVLMGIAHDWGDHEAGKWAWKTCQEVWPESEKESARLSPPAMAPCKHSWVEEENEADQLQTACELCGAIKPAPPAKDGGP